MILPVFAFGQPVLKKRATDINKDYEGLESLINNMWETMYAAHGVGIAAPQIGVSVRLFIIDSIQIMEEEKKAEGIKKVFINAQIIEETGELWSYEEGCLSIPNIRGDVERQQKVRIQYLDENFEKHDEIYEGINARVIQHEYDHIEGVLFVEKLKPLKKKLIQRKLNDIKTGKATADYKIKFVRL
ncbi:MAG: peptide deformylase [Saprospiraceae bacterium]|nr:peptide deformylase [Saprospiraceae bacterium]MBP6565513.1 peptide deformylase [Saprospiraceae bacterium]